MFDNLFTRTIWNLFYLLKSTFVSDLHIFSIMFKFVCLSWLYIIVYRNSFLTKWRWRWILDESESVGLLHYVIIFLLLHYFIYSNRKRAIVTIVLRILRVVCQTQLTCGIVVVTGVFQVIWLWPYKKKAQSLGQYRTNFVTSLCHIDGSRPHTSHQSFDCIIRYLMPTL